MLAGLGLLRDTVLRDGACAETCMENLDLSRCGLVGMV